MKFSSKKLVIEILLPKFGIDIGIHESKKKMLAGVHKRKKYGNNERGRGVLTENFTTEK